ncbi:hypothetical protein FCIRC_10051 [Fusarium circinatum]|uniref:Uncharacterized protein n=1 Tax=Fusarium circinatum TaxID=48490 RepID=A0A8H5WQ30_FUSCI|nr:hypothetical protein FCIRC_10051 [Fusarium circinatum]
MKGDVQRRKIALQAQIHEQQMNHERCLLNQAKPTRKDDDAAFNLTQRTAQVTEPRSQYYGGGLDLVGCSESMVEDQIADDKGEGCLKRRRVDLSGSAPYIASEEYTDQQFEISELVTSDGHVQRRLPHDRLL